ncbi:MAG TPA: tetratricopeptide repeat protein [Kofleriaceae bacterium]|nr:tetratricopeptide repeat protein [Kofleriaceae bacterium]
MSRSAVLGVVIGALIACRSTKPAERPLPPLAKEAYAAYLEGKLAGYREDWAAAAEALAAAAKAAPDQPMIAVELARAQAKATRTSDARATLALARKQWPAHAEVWLVSGDLLADLDKPAAIRAYRRAIELEPEAEDAYLGLAKLEAPAQAEATLERLVAKVPDSVEGHYLLAQRLAAREHLPRAVGELRAVLERDPDHLDARLDLARALRRTGNMAKAIEQTRSAFDRSGQALDIAEELYWLLCEADDRTAAIDLLTLLDDDRSDVEALAAVARLERGLGRLEEARAIARRIALVDADAAAVLVGELDAQTDREAAVKRLLALPRESARFVEARKVAATALLAAGDHAAAAAAIAPALGAAPKDLEARLLAAYASADGGDVAGARRLFGDPGSDLSAQLARARLAEHLGDLSAALGVLEPVLRAHPDSAPALNLAGYLLAEANQRLPDAERWLRKARELSPGDPAILDSWGWLLLRKGDVRGAIKVLDRAARFAPTEPEILLHLATAWAADRSPRTAATLLDRATALRPGPKLQRRIDALRATLR